MYETVHEETHQTPKLIEFRGFGIIPDGIPVVRVFGYDRRLALSSHPGWEDELRAAREEDIVGDTWE